MNALREDLLNYQRQFFKDALAESSKDAVKALIFGSSKDKAWAYHLAEIIARHEIAPYKSTSRQTFNEKAFETESGFIVPMNQPQYRLIKGMFEKRTQFQDSLFYDISSWTLSLASGVDFEELKTIPPLGEKITEMKMPAGKLLFELCKFFCKVSKDNIRACAFNAEQRFLHDPVTIKPSILAGSFYHGIFTAHIIGGNGQS